MITLALKSRECLIDDVKCLESKLALLQRRFDRIINWIRSQCFDLNGLPDDIKSALSEDNIELGRSYSNVKVECDTLNNSLDVVTNDDIYADGNSESGCNALPTATVTEDHSLIDEDFTLKCETDSSDGEDSTDCNATTEINVITQGSDGTQSVEGKRKLATKTAKQTPAKKRGNKLIVDAAQYKKMIASMPRKRLVCVVCNKAFGTPPLCRRHEIQVHLTKEEQTKWLNECSENEGTTMCNICNVPFKNIEEHRQIHLPAKDRKRKLIIDAAQYKEMIDSMPSRKRLVCVVCSKSFATWFLCSRHEIQVHLTKEDQKKWLNRDNETEEGATMCDICNFPFRNIEAHRLNHLPAESIATVEGKKRPHYRCLKCDQLFPAKMKYLDHITRECKAEEILENSNYLQNLQKLRTEKNFLCNQCGQTFNRKYTLKIHILAVHAKTRNFKCQFCEQTFTVENVRNNHEKKHLGTSRVTCDLCGFSFTCKQILRKHIRGVHENRRPYKCQLCDKSFKTSTARNYHLNTHGDPNGRKRGLNREVDPVRAAGKRRNCSAWRNNRLEKITTLADAQNEKASNAETISEESGESY